MKLQDALQAAGFTPDSNVCGFCKHHGSRHDLGNWCLDCPRPDAAPTFSARIDAGWCFFSSMSQEEQWAHGLTLFRLHLDTPMLETLDAQA